MNWGERLHAALDSPHLSRGDVVTILAVLVTLFIIGIGLLVTLIWAWRARR